MLRLPEPPQPDSSQSTRQARAQRLAALARVEARAGIDDVAAEHFRAAYRQHPDAEHLIAAAQSWERAKRYAEAHESVLRALGHALPDAERARLDAEVMRLRGLVPAGLVKVAVQVRPEGTRVVLTQVGKDSGEAIQRTVLGTGHIWLQPGLWNVESSAKGFQSHLMTFQSGGADGELLAVVLKPEEQGPVLVQTQPEGGAPVAPKPEVAHTGGDGKGVGPESIAGVEPERPPPREPGPVVELGYGAPRPQRSVLSRYGPLVLSALGVGALGGGGYFGWAATQSAADANALTGGEKDYKTQLDDLKVQAADRVFLANASFGAGGALLVAGTLWWALQPASRAALVVPEKLPILIAKESR
ncbi:MAG: hypothetical protein EXR79_03725 [Myxococcales bacterium]|nr:hypothetical protein [Myxococcales bacterium]